MQEKLSDLYSDIKIELEKEGISKKDKYEVLHEIRLGSRYYEIGSFVQSNIYFKHAASYLEYKGDFIGAKIVKKYIVDKTMSKERKNDGVEIVKKVQKVDDKIEKIIISEKKTE